MRFESETYVFKFLWRSQYTELLYAATSFTNFFLNTNWILGFYENDALPVYGHFIIS